MKKNLLQAALCLPLLFATDKAQAQHQHHAGCGTTIESQQATLDRMFVNRRQREDILARRTLRSGNDITYIPIQFHIVGKNDGTGHIDLDFLYAGMCRINADYRDQNIQFYMAGPPIYRNNDNLYTNAEDRVMSTYLMALYKVPNAMNVYIGNEIVDGPGQIGTTLAYYTSYPDVIYSIKSTINSTSKTLSHEIGHFLTLAHPFFGWENQDYRQVIQQNGGKPPRLINGNIQTEMVARSGGTDNCYLAADGFCDTKPDYNFGLLVGNNCSVTFPAVDPDSVQLDPVSASDNYMSYFDDGCTTGFSNEQKDAIVLDVIQRGYDRLDRPDTNAVVGVPTIEWPNASSPALNNVSNLRWTPVTNAKYYAVTIDKVTATGINIGRLGQWVTTEPNLWVTLAPNQRYEWKVRATNAVDFCSNSISTPVQFQSYGWASSVNSISDIQSSNVFPNPSGSDKQVSLEVNVANNTEASISIQNALGQQVMPKQNLVFVQGSNVETMDLSALKAGLYIINIETASGRISHKLILSE